MNPYEILKAHIAKHKYARGKNKGSAPLDSTRRRRDWELVVDRGDRMAVQRYSTDVLTVYPDGRVVVDCGGWSSSTNTRIAVTKGLSLMHTLVSMGSVRYRNMSQVVLNLRMGSVRYYDGITLAQDSGVWMVQELKPFSARVRDTERVGVWDEAIKASGFKNLFPILYMNAEQEHLPIAYSGYLDERRITDLLSSADQSEHWLSVVAKFKWDYKYEYTPGGYQKEWFARTRQETWSKLRSTLTKEMTKIIKTTDVCI